MLVSAALVLGGPALAQDLTPGKIQVTPEKLDFGTAKGPKAKTFAIKNVGGMPLQVTGLLENEAQFDFAEPITTPFVVEPGKTVTIDMVFRPEGSTEFTGTLIIYSSDMESLETRVELSGRGKDTAADLVSDIGAAGSGWGRSLAALAVELEPADFSQSSVWIGAEIEPTFRAGWGPAVAPRLSVGLLSPLLRSRLHPELAFGYAVASTLRDGPSDSVGTYSVSAQQQAFEISPGLRIRVLPVGQSVSPELGVAPVFQFARRNLEGEVGGSTIQPPTQGGTGVGIRLSAGVAALFHRYGQIGGHVAMTRVASGSEITGTVTPTAFSLGLSYRAIFRL